MKTEFEYGSRSPEQRVLGELHWLCDNPDCEKPYHYSHTCPKTVKAHESAPHKEVRIVNIRHNKRFPGQVYASLVDVHTNELITHATLDYVLASVKEHDYVLVGESPDRTKLYVVGSDESDPEKWSIWDEIVVVLAKNEEEAFELAGGSKSPVTELDMTKSVVIRRDHEPNMGEDL